MCHMLYDGATHEVRERIEGSCEGIFNYMPYEERWRLLKYLARESEKAEMRWRAEIAEVKAEIQALTASIQELHPETAPAPSTGYATSEIDLFDDDEYDEMLLPLDIHTPIYETNSDLPEHSVDEPNKPYSEINVQDAYKIDNSHVVDDIIENLAQGFLTEDPSEALMCFETCVGESDI
ncbi:hypothetical protein RND81_03G161300 [Saponaria officinalis]|uniref:Uncharacterized protein n=1 Tax=Saponaria officinalis TaxID=3572 RepID=A0AAW1M9G1_SAPOF